MRPGQNRRMRGRNRSKGPNPLTRSYESNGPDVKVRGTAQHIADKYVQLARDAQSSGDPVAAENYYQHAEHYYRIIAGAQEQFRQQFGGYGQRPYEDDEEGDEEAGPNGFPFAPGERPPANGGGSPDFGNQPQPFEARDERPQRFDRSDRNDRPDRTERPDRNERFDRGERSDRGERFGADRGGERNERPDRFARDRNDRAPRSDRGPPPFERGERDRAGADRNERADRGERFDRNERSDRNERPGRFGGAEAGPRLEPPRFEPPRDERGDAPRIERPREEADEPAAALPAFLTNPVRAPVVMDEAPEPPAPPVPSEADAAADGEGARRAPRRRRRTRYESTAEGAAPDGAAPAEDPTPVE